MALSSVRWMCWMCWICGANWVSGVDRGLGGRPATGVRTYGGGSPVRLPPGLGQEFQGADPVLVVVRDGGDQQLVCSGGLLEHPQLLDDGLRGAGELGAGPVLDQRPLLLRPG